MFECSRKSEYLEVVLRNFDYIPSKSPSALKRECLDFFVMLGKERAHKEFVDMMNKRQLDALEKDLIGNLPDSLISLALSLRLSKKQLVNFCACLRGSQDV